MIPAASGSYLRREGNRVRPLIGGREAFGRIAEAVDAARERVWLTVAFYADLLIKGAYTQSRLRQLIFGGATRYVLANARLPVMLAH